jgi:DNA mismatch endonuclease, patch repair protein
LPDVVDAETRSRMMSGIRARDTKPELFIRKGLHRLGFRFRLQSKDVPGKPDLVLPRYQAAIFAHGCFWHGHDCPLFRLPGTRTDFWEAKIDRNRARDHEVREQLADAGWRQLTVWECAMWGSGRIPDDDLIGLIADWVCNNSPAHEIRGAAS